MYQELITEAIKEVVASLGLEVSEIKLHKPVVEAYGDYATSVALKFPNSKVVADKIYQIIKQDDKLQNIVSEIQVVGPGFINFTLAQSALLENVSFVLNQKDDFGKSKLGNDQTVVIDYSSPNIAKRFSVGHLRSTTIGSALSNLYAALGYKVIGDNHLGDWGTQFGMILAAVKKNNLDIKHLSVDDLEKLYVDYAVEAKKDESMREEAKAWFKKLEAGDGEARAMWQSAVEISMVEFERIYRLLGVQIGHKFGESFYEDKMASVIAEAKAKSLAYESKGALIMDLPNMSPAMLLKSDGATTYFTRDLATVKYRLEAFEPKLIIYEVGAEQTLYFRQVFAASKKLGWTQGVDLVHVAHGLFLLSGKKMSTREGTTIKLEELLQKATQKARMLIDGAQVGKDMTEDEKNKISELVGIGAIKYFDLKHAPTSDINFVWEEALSMDGNSGPYVQYAAVRANSVLEKNGSPAFDSQFAHKFQGRALAAEELAILRALVHFPEILSSAAFGFAPNFLANYLYALAQNFNTFYAALKIGDDEFRLALTAAASQVLQNGLRVLNIRVPGKM